MLSVLAQNCTQKMGLKSCRSALTNQSEVPDKNSVNAQLMRNFMSENEIAGMLLMSEQDVRYFTGFILYFGKVPLDLGFVRTGDRKTNR